MKNERPSDCPKYIEDFVSDYYSNPEKFLPDAIEFTKDKDKDYRISFATVIDDKGRAMVETIWFHHKAENNSTWFEFDCINQTLI